MIQIKFGCDRPTGLRDIHVWKCEHTYTLADTQTTAWLVYFKLTLWVCGSGELITGQQKMLVKLPKLAKYFYLLLYSITKRNIQLCPKCLCQWSRGFGRLNFNSQLLPIKNSDFVFNLLKVCIENVFYVKVSSVGVFFSNLFRFN